MFKSKKLQKGLILGASGLALFLAGGNPVVQSTLTNAKSHLEVPISHADGTDMFMLSEPQTEKQFTVSSDSENLDMSQANELVSRKEHNYLSHVANLHNYTYHFSRVYTNNSSDDDGGQETGTITFIKK